MACGICRQGVVAGEARRSGVRRKLGAEVADRTDHRDCGGVCAGLIQDGGVIVPAHALNPDGDGGHADNGDG